MDKTPQTIEILIQTIKDLKISISKSPELLDDDGHFYQRVQFTCNGSSIHFPFMDEYDDIIQENPVVLLNFIVQECEFFEEASGYEVWCEDIGVNKDKKSSRDLYEELEVKVPQIRKLIGSEIKALNHYDIEFNTGLAQALRASSI